MAEEVINRDTQNADNATVPDHLWLRVFVLGNVMGGCLACHLEALDLMEGTAGFLDGPKPPIGLQWVEQAFETRRYHWSPLKVCSISRGRHK